MSILMESNFFEAICIISSLCCIFYWFITKNYSYWQDRGVPCKVPSFPFGSAKNAFLGTKHIGLVFDDFCKDFPNEPYFGVYEVRRPTLVVKDPELLKRILTKDFHNFTDRFVLPINMKNDYLSNHLFNMSGKDWRPMRMKLTPTFTSGRMKSMFLLIKKCKEQLKDYVESEIMDNPEIDVKDTLARFTMDIIATCAFGLEINSLSEKNCVFYNLGIKIFKPRKIIFTLLTRLIFIAMPFLSKIYVPRFTPEDITSFLTNLVRDTVEYREKNNVSRNDFLDLLIKIRQNKSLLEEEGQTNKNSALEKNISEDKAGLTIEEMAAQAFIFFAAGFETASSTMTFCLYELAQNPEVQDKLHQEITQVLEKHEGEITFQSLQDMTYMDQVIDETLRRYASLAILHRTCTEPYKMPDSDIVLEKGQRLIIPTYSIHHDPKYYPDPFKFDPERFAPEKVKERHPYVHLPFGEGPRMCIGKRFGLMQTKVGLCEMVLHFKFEMSSKTQVPITLHKSSFITMPEQPIFLHLTKR